MDSLYHICQKKRTDPIRDTPHLCIIVLIHVHTWSPVGFRCHQDIYTITVGHVRICLKQTVSSGFKSVFVCVLKSHKVSFGGILTTLNGLFEILRVC